MADQFLPPLVEGYARRVCRSTRTTGEGEQLLQEAGEKLPVALDFWYPTYRPRGYMPDPPRNFQAFAASLGELRLQDHPKPGQWRGGYVSGVRGTGTAVPVRLDG